MTLLSIGVAFVAGLVSFLSPCVLPIIPGFLAYLAGTSIINAEDKRINVFLNALFFVLGFSFVFSLLGVLLNSILVNIAGDAMVWLSRIGGMIIVFFGIYLTGMIKIPFLEKEYQFLVKFKLKSRYLSSFVFGAAFAVGWTPCVGPVLGGILALAVTQPGMAFALLFAYSVGLGLPFLVVGLFSAPAAYWINKLGPGLKVINLIFGIILICLGVLVFTQSLSLIANYENLNRWLLK